MVVLLGGAAAWTVWRERPRPETARRMVLHENLLAAFHTGEFVAETRTLSLGSMRGKAQTVEADRHEFGAATGILSRPDGDPPYAWLVGLRPWLDLDVLQPLDRELELQIASGVPGAQRVSLRFNGQGLGTHALPADGSVARLILDVPADLQRRGRNRLQFRFDAVDVRQLADEPVALPIAGVITRLRFAPRGDQELAVPAPRRFGLVEADDGVETKNVLIVPPGMSARVAISVPTTQRVALTFTLQAVSVPLEVSVLPDSGRRTLLRTFQPTDEMPRDLRFDLTPWAGEALTIEFWARAGDGTGARIGPAHVRVPEGMLLSGANSVQPGVVRPQSPPSFLVVTLDALARRQLESRVTGATTSPVLDAIFAGGIVFTEATAPASYTLASVGSLLTGQDPLIHGVTLVEDERGVRHLGPDVPTLASVLREAGWRTAAFVTNPNAAARHGFDKGFDRYEELFADPALWEPGVSGEHLSPRLANWLVQVADQPFLAYVHVFEPHAPYAAPADLLRAFVRPYAGAVRGDRTWIDSYRSGRVGVDAAGLAHLRELYGARVALADRVLGEIVNVLRQAGRLENTVLVVLSDHGEAFGEHGLIEHGDHVYGEQIDIPLVFVLPGRNADRLGGPATLTDVAPTLLGLAGLPQPGTMGGIDLLTLEAGRPRALMARSAARLPVLSWTRFPMRLHVDLATRRVQLYDLLLDPAELTNLVDERPATSALLYRELTEAVCAAEAARSQTGPAPTSSDEQLSEQLRAIGYIGDGDGLPGSERLCDQLRMVLRRP